MSDTVVDRNRAAELLGAPPESSPAQARSLFLQRLERTDFVPPAEWCAGLSGMDDTARAGGFRCAESSFSQPSNDPLQADLKAFVAEYWQLSPEYRTERWTSLFDRSRDRPALRKYVDHLAAGLEIESYEFENLEGMASLLGGIVRDTFPLDPVARSSERNKRAATLKGTAGWRTLPRSFRTNYPRLAALDGDLLDHLEEAAGSEDQYAPLRTYQPVRSVESEKKNWWPAYLFVIVAIGILKAAFNSNSSSSSRYDSSESKSGSNRPSQNAFSPAPKNRLIPEKKLLVVPEPDHLEELRLLVLNIKVRADESSYRKLKDFLESPKAEVLRQSGHSSLVYNARQQLAEYERSRLRAKDFRP